MSRFAKTHIPHTLGPLLHEVHRATTENPHKSANDIISGAISADMALREVIIKERIDLINNEQGTPRLSLLFILSSACDLFYLPLFEKAAFEDIMLAMAEFLHRSKFQETNDGAELLLWRNNDSGKVYWEAGAGIAVVN